jgi:S-DNA-T family DNA segregation ATPase FtsK/SpoIIIE
MTELGCRSTRERIPSKDGTIRQIRGYLITDIRTAAQAIRNGHLPDTDDD